MLDAARSCPTLLSAEQARKEDTCSIHGEQRPDRIELCSEDLQHDESEAELADRGANVRPFESSLSCLHSAWISHHPSPSSLSQAGGALGLRCCLTLISTSSLLVRTTERAL